MTKPRKPTNLKLLQGTHRKERANPKEPIYEIVIPSPPDHLSKDGLVEWERISDVLFRMGLLSEVDMGSLAAYCQAFGRWSQAERELNESTLTLETIQGNIIQNPLVGVANQAMEHMRKHLTEFGMTPASRSKVSAKTKDTGKDEWSDFG